MKPRKLLVVLPIQINNIWGVKKMTLCVPSSSLPEATVPVHLCSKARNDQLTSQEKKKQPWSNKSGVLQVCVVSVVAELIHNISNEGLVEEILNEYWYLQPLLPAPQASYICCTAIPKVSSTSRHCRQLTSLYCVIENQLTVMASHFLCVYIILLCPKGTIKEQFISVSELRISKSLWNSVGKSTVDLKEMQLSIYFLSTYISVLA